MSVAEISIPAGTWRTDPVHSTVEIQVTHLGISAFRASFRDFEAWLTSGPSGAELQGAASVASFDVQDQDLQAHVMTPDFLDAGRHPKLSFHSSRIEQSADGAIAIDGDLTIKSTTLEVTAQGRLTGPIADPFGGERLSLALETIIDRTRFGIDWQLELPSGGQALANEVRLVAALELVKEA